MNNTRDEVEACPFDGPYVANGADGVTGASKGLPSDRHREASLRAGADRSSFPGASGGSCTIPSLGRSGAADALLAPEPLRSWEALRPGDALRVMWPSVVGRHPRRVVGHAHIRHDGVRATGGGVVKCGGCRRRVHTLNVQLHPEAPYVLTLVCAACGRCVGTVSLAHAIQTTPSGESRPGASARAGAPGSVPVRVPPDPDCSISRVRMRKGTGTRGKK